MEERNNKRELLARKANIHLSLVCLVAITLALGSPVSAAPAHTLQATPAQGLSAGSFWSLTGTARRTATGDGSDSGSWTRDWPGYTDKFVVVNRTATSISVSWSETGPWSSTATDTWVSDSGGATNKGTFHSSATYTVDLGTYKVSAVSDTYYSDRVGHPAWFLLNPKTLTPGGTVLLGWYVPSSDATSETFTDVPWTVAQDWVSVKGNRVVAWKGTHTGEHFGWWASDKVRSQGTRTETDYFDSTYGIFLGDSVSENSSFNRAGGGWTETYTDNDMVSDTNLVFPVSAIVAAPGGVTISVDGVAVTGAQVFTWEPSSTHTLAVNATVEGAPGVRYVFVEWADGSTQTTRSVTASQSANYTAIFKTQYKLTVNSDFGDPQGTGWYDAGSQATFSVTSPVPAPLILGWLGSKTIFQSWTGDSTATTPTGNITMDGPKTVQAQWSGADSSQAFLATGGAVAAIVIAIAVAIVLMRRKGGAATPHEQMAPAEPRPAETMKSSPLMSRRKKGTQVKPQVTYCTNCRAKLPAEAEFCGECGQPVKAVT